MFAHFRTDEEMTMPLFTRCFLSHQQEAEDSKADRVTKWKDPESLNHSMEESLLPARNTVIRLLREQEIDFYCVKLLKYGALLQ